MIQTNPAQPDSVAAQATVQVADSATVQTTVQVVDSTVQADSSALQSSIRALLQSEYAPEWLRGTYGEFLLAGAVFAAVAALLWLVRLVLAKRLGSVAKRTSTDYDDLVVDLVVRTKVFFLFALALLVAWPIMLNPPVSDRTKELIVVAAMFVQGVIWANGVISFAVGRISARQNSDGHGNVAIIQALGGAVRVVVFIALFLFALDSVYDVTPLIAGLGIGGIAIALAVQNILGDLFGAVSILVDKPFVVGDFVVVGDMKGTIEHIGMKSTRVRSLGGEQIIFSNADLLGSRIRNFKRMMERRVAFNTGVTYDTDTEKLARIPLMIREIVEKQHPIRFERSHFLRYMDSWLEYETIFWVLEPDYMKFADIQQAINIELHRKFAEEGIEFAFPTRTLFARVEADVKRLGGGSEVEAGGEPEAAAS